MGKAKKIKADPELMRQAKRLIRLARKYCTNKDKLGRLKDIKVSDESYIDRDFIGWTNPHWYTFKVNLLRIEGLGNYSISIGGKEGRKTKLQISYGGWSTFADLGSVAEITKETAWKSGFVIFDGERIYIPEIECQGDSCYRTENVKESDFSYKDLCPWCRAKETRKMGGRKSEYIDEPCGICGRRKNVKNTVVGPRCQYCRSTDSRHIGVVRSLGGTPNVDGVPITRYLEK